MQDERNVSSYKECRNESYPKNNKGIVSNYYKAEDRYSKLKWELELMKMEYEFHHSEKMIIESMIFHKRKLVWVFRNRAIVKYSR